MATDALFGSLDLLILRVLGSGERCHGYAITERIQACSDALRVEEGSLYPALHRMAAAGWVKAEWGVSEHNRRARYYRITPAGRRPLAELGQKWSTHVAAVKRVLRLA